VAAGRPLGTTGGSVEVSPRRSRHLPSSRQGRRHLASRGNRRRERVTLRASSYPELKRARAPGCRVGVPRISASVAAFSQRLPERRSRVSSPMPNRLIELTNGPAALTTGPSPAAAGLNRVLPSLRLRFAPRRTLGANRRGPAPAGAAPAASQLIMALGRSREQQCDPGLGEGLEPHRLTWWRGVAPFGSQPEGRGGRPRVGRPSAATRADLSCRRGRLPDLPAAHDAPKRQATPGKSAHALVRSLGAASPRAARGKLRLLRGSDDARHRPSSPQGKRCLASPANSGCQRTILSAHAQPGSTVAAGSLPRPAGGAVGCHPALARRARSHFRPPALPAHEQPEAPRGCERTTDPRRQLRWGVAPALPAPATLPARQVLPGKSSQQLLPAAGPPGARAARSAPSLQADHRSAPAAPLGWHHGAPGAGHPAAKASAVWQVEPTAAASGRHSRRTSSPKRPVAGGGPPIRAGDCVGCHHGAPRARHPSGNA
jgi:hypothetical protein